MSNARSDSSYNLCTFQFANGKCCGMPAHPKHNGLCLNHATIHRRTLHREDDLFAELVSPNGEFLRQVNINHVLGKLFEALASNRVSPKRAATLAYIGHLLLQSQRGAKKEAGQVDFDYRVLLKLLNMAYPTNGKPVKLNPNFDPVKINAIFNHDPSAESNQPPTQPAPQADRAPHASNPKPLTARDFRQPS